MAEIQAVPTFVVLAAGLVAAATDVWKFRVYNALTIPLFLSGLAFHSWNAGFEGLMFSAGGAAFGFAILFVPYLLGLMGAGDVKLLAGVGAWLGTVATMHVFAVSALATGIYALALIWYRGKLAESWALIRLIFYRLAAAGVYAGKDDLLEELSVKSDRRLRVIPFGASVPIGVIGAAIWLGWFG